MGYVGTAPVKGDYRKLDNVSSGFNGVDTAFTLQVGSVSVTPPKETTVIISVGGILQEPVVAYTISGSIITFTSAPVAGAGFFGMLMGDSYTVGLPDIADGTITEAKLAANSVNSGKIADDAIDSEHYTDGSIDNEHIADGTIALAKTALVAGTGITFTTDTLSVNASQTQITSVGELTTGSIASGFGTINNGANSITTTGTLAAGATTVNGNLGFTGARSVTTSTGDLTLFPSGNVIVPNNTNLVVGHSTTVQIGDSAIGVMITDANNANSGSLSVSNFDNANTPSKINFGKGNSDDVTNFAAITTGYVLGQINFLGADGTDLDTQSARIEAVSTGTIGTGRVPSILNFYTGTDAASTVATLALTLDSAQNATFAGALTLSGDEIIGNGYGLIVGHTAQVTTFNTPEFQVLGTGTGVGADSNIMVARFSNDTIGPAFQFVKSRDPAIADGTFAIVQDGDSLGGIWWQIDDGTDYLSTGAKIEAFADGTPGADDTPTKLVFSTTPDGSNYPSAALTIWNTQASNFWGYTSINYTNAQLGLNSTGTGSSSIYMSDAGNNRWWIGNQQNVAALQFWNYTHQTYGLQISNTNSDVVIASGAKLLLDGSLTGDTYMVSTTANEIDWFVGGANDMRLQSTGNLHVDGDIYAFSTTISSDERLKENIETWDDALAKVKSLRGVEFDWRDSTKGHSGGVIAQEVEAVLPWIVKTNAGLNDDPYKTVNYSALNGLLIEAVKALSDKVMALEKAAK